MLGADVGESDDQVTDAMGEICNMIAGNFKNKLAGADGRCMLSVPTVIRGEEYTCRSLADGDHLETVILFGNAPVGINLQLHG
jgi:chemotaxis protein CheX